jgi:hypothetical protein
MNFFGTKPVTRSVAVDYSGGDQNLGAGLGPCQGIYVGGAGNLVCRLQNDSADTTFTGLLVGHVYHFAVAVIRQSGSSITNSRVLY